MTEKPLEYRIQRLEAIQEIHNIMGIYEYFHSAGMYKEKVARIFSQKSPTVCAEVGTWGHFVGIESVRRLYEKMHPWGIGGGDMENFRRGSMYEHDLTTPVIQVAGDLKTAKGVWMSPGHETRVDRITGEVQAGWCWVKYACDFLNEDEEWKIWHCFIFLTFFAPYHKGWMETGEHPSADQDMDDAIPNAPFDMAPDQPSVMRHNPYAPTYDCMLLPAYPEPYKSYDGLGWMDPGNPKIQGMYKDVDI